MHTITCDRCGDSEPTPQSVIKSPDIFEVLFDGMRRDLCSACRTAVKTVFSAKLPTPEAPTQPVHSTALYPRICAYCHRDTALCTCPDDGEY